MILVALAIRLAVVSFEYPGQLKPRYDHFPFGYETGRIARSIVSGQGFSNPLYGETGPTALLPPVYPYLLAGVFELFGTYTKNSAISILSLNSLFSALTCLPIYFLARKSFGERVAMGAGWAWAVFPHAIYLSADWIWDGCLATLLLTLVVLVALYLESSTRIWAWAGFGSLWGVAALTSPTVLSVFPFLCGWLCYRLHRKGKHWGLPVTAAAATLVLAIAPWMTRNYRTFHQFIPLRDGFWLEVYVGNTGDTSTYWSPWAHPTANQSEMEEYRRVGELAYMAEKRRQAVQFITTHWAWFARETLQRVIFFWTGVWRLPPPHRMEVLFDPDEPFDPATVAVYTTLALLAVLGLRRAFRQHNPVAWPFVLVLISFPLVHYITHPDIRYRHPMDPEMLVLAVYAVAGWLDKPNRVAREGSR